MKCATEKDCDMMPWCRIRGRCCKGEPSAANQPYDTYSGPPVNAKCDKCGKPAAVVAPDFALCAEHGAKVIAYIEALEAAPRQGNSNG